MPADVRPFRILLPLAVAATLSCGGDAGEGGPPRAPAVGDPVPAFTGSRLGGDSLSLRELGAPALVNLWATWCPPCRHETPFLQELWERYGPRGLRVVGISSDASGARDQVERFIAEAGVTYDIVLDPSGRTMDLFRVVGLPATYLVDAEGRITLARTGPVSETDSAFLGALEALLEQR